MTSIRAANVRGLVFPQTTLNVRFRIFRYVKLPVGSKLSPSFGSSCKNSVLSATKEKNLIFTFLLYIDDKWGSGSTDPSYYFFVVTATILMHLKSIRKITVILYF
jgi:hypothetical protein